MKKIVKIKLSKSKSVLAAEVRPNEYISVEGIRYTNPSPEYIEETSDSEVSKELKAALHNLQYAYEELMEIEKKQDELNRQKANIQMTIKKAEKRLKDFNHDLSIADFSEAFCLALPDGLKEQMYENGFYVEVLNPISGVSDNAICIKRDALIACTFEEMKTYMFLYREYEYDDEKEFYMYSDADKYLEYQRVLYANERHLSLHTERKSYLHLRDGMIPKKCSNLYCCTEYVIPLKKTLTKEYAKELAEKITKDFVYDD